MSNETNTIRSIAEEERGQALFHIKQEAKYRDVFKAFVDQCEQAEINGIKIVQMVKKAEHYAIFSFAGQHFLMRYSLKTTEASEVPKGNVDFHALSSIAQDRQTFSPQPCFIDTDFKFSAYFFESGAFYPDSFSPANIVNQDHASRNILLAALTTWIENNWGRLPDSLLQSIRYGG